MQPLVTNIICASAGCYLELKEYLRNRGRQLMVLAQPQVATIKKEYLRNRWLRLMVLAQPQVATMN